MPQLFAKPGELLAAANKILCPDLSRVDMFITAAVVYVNPRSGEIISASAGHCALLRITGGVATSSDPKNSGMPLGIQPEVYYPQLTQTLPPGGAALLYTDGLTESRNPDGELLGDQNLQAYVVEAVANSGHAEEAKISLLKRLAAYRAGGTLMDDETFILIRNQK
jgi:sigma-B regulation protein RsbU (phosphoserine phosphatase)